MLIQRDAPVRVWGKADPDESVSVAFRGQTVRTQADALGRWSVTLAPAPAGGPFELTVQGKNAITVKDVVAGDVWIASGQSNMGWTVRQSDNAGQEIAAASYPNIRLFKVALKVAHYPQEDVKGEWAQCSPESAGDFSGVGYYFARHLHQKLNIPVEWPELREAQVMALELANTGMAVTIDIGNPANVHPTNKQDVGLRLGLAARAIAYGEKIVYSGPIFRQAAREGASLRLWFDHVGGELKGFEIAGSDGEFAAAQARIDGPSVVVSSAGVREPVSARYAWAESPECNLYNAEGLPASPFQVGTEAP
jgi:hypothetical protein